jgi:membrane-bound serine protease (ClpP class)
MTPFMLVAIGFIFIFVEFYVPGLVFGILGGFLIVSSIIVFALEDHSPVEVVAFIGAVLFSLGFLISFTLRRIPKAKPRFSIYLNSDQEGYQASEYDPKLIGKTGIVLSDLKLSGHVLIEGKSYQALSQSEYLVKGTKIVVIDGRGAFLIVKESNL